MQTHLNRVCIHRYIWALCHPKRRANLISQIEGCHGRNCRCTHMFKEESECSKVLSIPIRVRIGVVMDNLIFFV